MIIHNFHELQNMSFVKRTETLLYQNLTDKMEILVFYLDNMLRTFVKWSNRFAATIQVQNANLC